MNAVEFAKSLAKKLQLSQVEINKRMEDLTAIIMQELAENRSISFPNFGILEPQKRNERISINPASGQRMLVPPRVVAKFKPAAPLKDRLKNMEV